MIYVIKPGDTIYDIAREYGVPMETILDVNEITNPEGLMVGQAIVIPQQSEPTETILVNGYCYPSINRATLARTLPDLTYLSIFSYKVAPNGTLTPIDDEPLIQAAKGENTASMMVITNSKPNGGFDQELARVILNNSVAQEILFKNIESTLQEKGYYGVDVDFEYVGAENRESYNQFLQKLADRIRPKGYSLSTAVAPKTRAGQPGVLYEGHDYAFHGQIADHVIIMTYEWGYTYGPPMAVAPLDQVERVIAYAVTEMPAQKILMGIPNYGYDWTLPYTPGTAARALTNTAAVALAQEVRAQILFDMRAMSPYFNYYDAQRREHVVWFEDARSIQAKLELMQRFGLGGVSYWTINSYFPQNWLVLNEMFRVGKVLPD